MFNLADKINKSKNGVLSPEEDEMTSTSIRQAKVRERFLIKEVPEISEYLPETCSIHFPSPDHLEEFNLTIKPNEGYWMNGAFTFRIFVPEDYNNCPPKVTCLTKIWHPNIDEEGNVCLSLLRQNSVDANGWAPTRRLRDVVWGLNSLFSDLLDFNDPLNVQAAQMYKTNKSLFESYVKSHIKNYK